MSGVSTTTVHKGHNTTASEVEWSGGAMIAIAIAILPQMESCDPQSYYSVSPKCKVFTWAGIL